MRLAGIQRSPALLRLLGIGCLIAIASVALGSTSGSRTATAADVKFKYGYFEAIVPLISGMERKDFANLGVTFVAQDSGATALPLIAGGTLAGIADIASPPLIVSLNKNIGLKIVWITGTSPQGLVLRPDVQAGAGLRGKKIAAAGGSIGQFLLQQYLAQYNLKLSDIQFIDLAPPDMPAAFQTGQIDGAYIWPPVFNQLIQAGGRKINNVYTPIFVVFGSKFVNEHRSIVQTFVCDLAKTHRRFAANPGGVWGDIAKHLKLPKSEVRSLLPKQTVAPVKQATRAYMGTSKGAKSKLGVQIQAIGKSMAEAATIPSAPKLGAINKLLDPRFAAFVQAGKCGR